MLKFIKSALLSLSILGALSGAAVAANQCNDREEVMKLLSKKYKEAPVSMGVTNTGGLVEVLSSDGGATWTIIITSPKGMSCLVAAGEGWKLYPAAVPDGPET